jgi:hypothetical protein
LRDELAATAPQPLAEALAALDGVRNVHQARTAVFAAARVTARLVGSLALAGQLAAHAADASVTLPEPAADAVRRLRRHGLADDEWLGLAGAITATHGADPDAFALPMLVRWCHQALTPTTRLTDTRRDLELGALPSATPTRLTPTRLTPETIALDLRATAGMMRARPDARATFGPSALRATVGVEGTPATPGAGAALSEAGVSPPADGGGDHELAPPTTTAADELAEALALKARIEESLSDDEGLLAAQLTAMVRALERALRPMRWLADVHMTVPRDDVGERWTGVRRPIRTTALLRGATAAVVGRPVLCNSDGAVVLPLWPLFQIAPPAPGHPDELFVLDGPAQAGARLVSLPTGFERSDASVWPALATLVSFEADSPGGRAAEKAPYRGLAQFTPGDADLFVGREREAEGFANRLRITPLLAVVGPSGAGKSSFIQAGVMPLLGDGWTRLIVRPGGAPMAALDAMLVGAGVVPALEGATGVAGERLAGERLAAALTAWATAQRQHVLLYIDQFEELFTLCHDAAERDRFVDALLRASLRADAPVRVVLTVRDDFLLRCQQLEALRDRLVHGLQLLATPTPADLRRILVEPARRVGYTFDDPALPDEMVAATDGMAAALPLLSFTAAQLWELRDRQAKQITRTAYASLGGVGGALAQHAERVLAALSEERRGLVRVAFRNLVTAEGTRAILTRAELQQLLGSHADAEAVLEALIGARLLAAGGAGDASDHVEVVHEALLSAWPRLLDWRREDAEGARLRDQLRAAARQWHERGRPRGLLWRDEALTEFLLWRARQPGPLTDVEVAFGAASEREAQRARRVKRAVLVTIGAILAIGLVVALVLYRQAEGQRAEAAAQKTKAQQSEALAKAAELASYVSAGQRAALVGDANQALVYLTAARKAGAEQPAVTVPLAIARHTINAELLAYRGHDKKTWALTVLPGEQRFVTGGADGVVNLWAIDRADPIATLRDAKDAIRTASSSRDGQLIAVPSYDGHVRLYRAEDGALVHTLAHGPGQVWWAVFLAEDRQLASVASDGTVAIWGVADGTLIERLTVSPAGAGTPTASRDGRWLALPGGDGSVQVWDTQTRAVRWRTGDAHAGMAWAAAYSSR